MPSPFPGMNPYLERAGVWEMFHTQFISLLQQDLTAQIRPRYVVRIEARVYIHEPPAARRFVGEPDVGISRTTPGVAVASSPSAVLAPAYGTLPAWVETEKSRYLEIRDRVGNQLVTVIELLSPCNKYAGPDREQYLAKRNQVFLSRAHLVELDLLRGGPRMPIEGTPDGDYFAIVVRAEERPQVGIWSWQLRDPMPVVPIPLGAGDPDAAIDLKATLDRVYDAGGYEDQAYDGTPEPRLAPDDATWAATFLPARA